jgi:hypothetical protein
MLKQILHEIFYTLTAALLILSVMELLFPGIVLAYININLVLIFWVFNVILILSINKNNNANR